MGGGSLGVVGERRGFVLMRFGRGRGSWRLGKR